jgi:mycothiol system anti-sigma-R factor
MDCREFQKFLHVFLDGEFDERDQGEVQGHLRECAACRRQAEFERWFREGVRRSVRAEAPPPHLRERILVSLDREASPRALRFLRDSAAPLAAMLLLTALLGYTWSLANFAPFGGPSSPARASARPAVASAPAVPEAPARVTTPRAVVFAERQPAAAAVAAKAVPARRAEARPARRPVPVVAEPESDEETAEPPSPKRQLELEVVSSDPDELARYLQRRLARFVEVPTFRGKARLVGGSVSPHDATAQIVYRLGDEDITLHVTPRPDPRLPARGIVVRQEGAHRVAVWKRRGLTYSMTALLDPAELVRMVSEEISPPQPPPASWHPSERTFPERNFSTGEAMPVSVER